VVGGYGSEAAYVFEKNAHNSWTQTAKLTAGDDDMDDDMDDDLFGRSVDIFGDTIIVGAALHNKTGAAYMFSRQDGGNWTQAAKITASDGAERDYFGYSVAASEDFVVVGNHLWSGAVYIFEKDAGSDNWKETTELLHGVYSEALSVSGDVLAVSSGILSLSLFTKEILRMAAGHKQCLLVPLVMMDLGTVYRLMGML
jgi:hypothetical protein